MRTGALVAISGHETKVHLVGLPKQLSGESMPLRILGSTTAMLVPGCLPVYSNVKPLLLRVSNPNRVCLNFHDSPLYST